MNFVALALFAASASAVATTNNDCLLEQGSVHIDACRSLWFKICDNYTILPADTCNIETFGDASLSWFSDSVDVSVWNYVMRYTSEAATDDSAPNSDQWGRLLQDDTRECVPESLGSSVYSSLENMSTRHGSCGYKFQIINNSELGQFDFTVLRNGAETIVAGLTLAAATLALF